LSSHTANASGIEWSKLLLAVLVMFGDASESDMVFSARNLGSGEVYTRFAQAGFWGV
jgi:hypothetical protein